MLKAHSTAGFTMIEVLVALALMLAGLAGAGIVLGQSIQFERESGSRRAAIRLAGSLAEELRALDVEAITEAGRYWLFLETADEVLDYREAVAFYEGALHTIVQGGDHTLVSFPEHVPELVDWAQS